MSTVVQLQDIVNEMVELNDRHTAFLNRATGEMVTLNEQTRALLEAAASGTPLDRRLRELHRMMEAGQLVELPGKYEQKLFTTIEQFCETVREPDRREELHRAVRGKRAFREFKKAVKALGLYDHWIGFRNQAFEQLAAAWLDEQGIAYRRAA